MKYAAAVLRNITTSAKSVGYAAIIDAFLSGGVALDEVILLPYDDPGAVMSALTRLKDECGGVFLICDRVLLPVAREAVTAVAGGEIEDLLETDTCLFAVVSADERGKDAVKTKIVPAVDKRRGQSYYSVIVKTVYAPLSKVLTAVKHASDGAGGQVAIHTGEEFGVGRIEVIYNRNTPKVAADEAVRILASELSEYVYALEDVNIAERLFDALKLHRLRIATAESFTGGGVGRAIVSVPGASKVFYEGLNTYDNKSKMARLGVSEYTLRSKGAVSGETACEMAQGILKDGNVDVVIATTGIAGPDSDASGTPAGKCFIAVGTKEAVRVFEYRLEGDRETVTKLAINLALFQAYKQIR